MDSRTILMRFVFYLTLFAISQATLIASPLKDSVQTSLTVLKQNTRGPSSSQSNDIAAAHFNIAVHSYTWVIDAGFDSLQGALFLEKVETHLIKYITQVLRKERLDFEALHRMFTRYSELDFVCAEIYARENIWRATKTTTIIAAGAILQHYFERLQSPIFLLVVFFTCYSIWTDEIKIEIPYCIDKSEEELQRLRRMLVDFKTWELSRAPDVVLALEVLEAMQADDATPKTLQSLHERLFYLFLKIEASFLKDDESHFLSNLIPRQLELE